MSASARRTVDLSSARVLISNDDGIHANGLKALEKAVLPLAGEVRTVAPDAGRSGASHMVSINHRLNLHKVGPGERYMVDGTPADAAMVGIQGVFSPEPPDLVLSGINHGLNLGDDLFSSGTVGVAVEACLQNIPAIAFSAARSYDPQSTDLWEEAGLAVPGVLEVLCRFGWPRDTFYNVNFPNRPYADIAGIAVVPQGRMDRAPSFELADPAQSGDDLTWRLRHIGGEGIRAGTCDYSAVREGYVTVTPVRVEITDHATLEDLREAFG